MDNQKEFESVKVIVLKLLQEDERCRNSDKFIIYRLLKENNIINISYEEFDERFPFNFESLRRCRQLLQADNQELRASEITEVNRDERRKQFKSFFQKGNEAPNAIIGSTMLNLSGSRVEVKNIVKQTRGIEIFER